MNHPSPSRIGRFGYASLYALCVIVYLGVTGGVHAADAERPKRVLFISTGSRLSPGFTRMDRAILEALGTNPSKPVDMYAENLDILRFPTDRFRRIFSDYLIEKYSEQRPDLIVLVFVGSLAVTGQLLHEIFPGTPVVVAGATEEEVRADHFRSPVSGVAFRVNPRATLQIIFRLQPETRRIVVVAGTAEVDRQVLDRVKEAARSFDRRARFEFWDNRSLAQLRQEVAALPPETVILFSRTFRAGDGQAVISTQVGQAIAQWANVPVYVMAEASMGTGAVGGSLSNVDAIGKRAGEMARLILNGTAPRSLPLETDTGTVPTFDWRALKRWHISESRLPPHNVVLFRQPLVWEQYRWYILGALIICIQGAMIGDLLLGRRRRRRIEAELRESRELMELATTAGDLGLWSRDLKTGDLWANAAMRSLFAFGADKAILFEDMLARTHPDDRARILAEVERAEAAELPFEGEFRILRPDGAERWVLAKGRTLFDFRRRGRRRMGVVLEITERKRAAEALEKERAFLRQVIDVDPNFIFAKDREGRFTLANQAVADAYGTTVDNLIGKTDADFNPDREEVESFRRVDREVIDTLKERFIPEEHLTDARGNVRWVQTVKRPIIESDGSARQVLGASTDITRRKETEIQLLEQRAELAHVARISTMGELAASLAHELNQPLTAILSNAQAALRFLTGKPVNLEEVREILHDIVEDNSRAGEIIRRMRTLAKKERIEFTTLDLASLVRDVAMLVHSDAVLQNIRVSLGLDDGLPSVAGDRVQLQQVVLNLLLNAFDAMKDCPVTEREVRLWAEREEEDAIRVAVSDRGTGLSGDKLDKIFEPFYTTKGEGLGMGLSICRSIIEAHGGRLWAENNRERGATFYVTLPIAKAVDEQGLSTPPGSGEE